MIRVTRRGESLLFSGGPDEGTELLRGGAPGVHFYTLNKARSTVEIVRGLGLA